MLRFGIMSTARIAVDHLIPAMQRADNCVVAAIASRSHARARTVADRFGVPLAFGSYDELLACEQIDAVYIPLPTSDHVTWTLKCAAAGKHVLCEKPIALKAGDIERLVRARDRRGVLVSEAFMVTYHPQWQTVRRLIAEGAIGQLRQVDAVFTYYNVDPRNMRNRVELGGGVIPDIGVYPTVVTRFATGAEPIRLQATVEFDPRMKIDRYASVRADFGSFEAAFYLSTQLANRQHIAFHGDKGFIELTAPFNSNLYEGDEVRLHDRAHRELKVFRFTGVNQYQLQVEAFSRAASGEDQPVFTLEDSIRNQRMIDAIYKAGRSSRWVKV